MRKIGVLLVLAIVAAFTVSSSSFAADPYSYRYSGTTATANFSRPDVTGCVVTETYVFAMDAVNAVGKVKSPYSWIYVSIYDRDACAGGIIREIYGSTELAPNEFTVAKNLSSASLRATIPVHHVTLGHWGTMEVEIAWAGTGAAYHGVSQYRDRTPGFMVRDHSVGTQRSAEADGAVWDAEGDYARGESDYAYVMSTRSGTLVIVK